MILDNDQQLLRSLTLQLKPWDFTLTTLDDPRQFWDVLQAVSPDLLILASELPLLSPTDSFSSPTEGALFVFASNKVVKVSEAYF